MKKNMLLAVSISLFIFSAGSFAQSAPTAGSGMKIAYVDIQQAIQAVKAGKDAKKQEEIWRSPYRDTSLKELCS